MFQICWSAIPYFHGSLREIPCVGRPISLLALPGKLLEKLVHKQLCCYLHINKLLSYMQHGFRAGKSTSTALQEFMLYITQGINRTQVCSCTFIDLSKAFDSLNHEVLLHKLRSFGLTL